jgi:hypothetical protein
MKDWHEASMEDVPRLLSALKSSVEMMTDCGRESPDWDRIINDLEQSEEGLDLGGDMESPVIKALLREGRKLYREMKEELLWRKIGTRRSERLCMRSGSRGLIR